MIFSRQHVKHAFFLMKICGVIHFTASLTKVTSFTFNGRRIIVHHMLTTWLVSWWSMPENIRQLEDVFTSSPPYDWTSMAHRSGLPVPSLKAVTGVKVQLLTFPLSNDFCFTYQVADLGKMHASTRNRVGSHKVLHSEFNPGTIFKLV